MVSLLLQSLSNLTIQGQIKMVDIMSLPAKEHCMCVKCKAMLAFRQEFSLVKKEANSRQLPSLLII